MLDYFRWRGTWITFNILSTNTLTPEILETNPPGKTITVLSDVFFTNLVCGESVDKVCEGVIPAVDIDMYVRGLHWRKRWEFGYMKGKARAFIWVEKELFRRFATFQDNTNGG